MARYTLYNDVVATYAMSLAREKVSRVTRGVEGDAKVIAPVDTGRLKTSIGTTTRETKWKVKAKVGSRVRYALVQHEGGRPHKIRARRVKFLRFYWAKVGKVVYFRSVNHPGNKPTVYLTMPLVHHGAINGFRVEVFNTPRVEDV